jgi:hypothetical protein
LSQVAISVSKREFLLYWVGFSVAVVAAVSILMTFSSLLLDVLSYRCWYPVISPMLGVSEPPKPTQIANMPYYCASPAEAVVRFVFNLLASLVVLGAGFYMMMNGKKH